jgi:hypothetical protein
MISQCQRMRDVEHRVPHQLEGRGELCSNGSSNLLIQLEKKTCVVAMGAGPAGTVVQNHEQLGKTTERGKWPNNMDNNQGKTVAGTGSGGGCA